MCRRGVVSQESLNKEGVLRYKLEKVEEQIDKYWRQRAHIKWLQYGDRNTAFFHAACTERKRRNRIGKIRKEDGGFVEEEGEKRRFITNHFINLFRSTNNNDTHQLLQCVQRKVMAQINEALLKEFTRDEVYQALKSIGSSKAPGPDGLPSLFYKEFWDTVGDDVMTEVLQVLRGGQMPPRWNETTIVLIPKVRRPENIKDLNKLMQCHL